MTFMLFLLNFSFQTSNTSIARILWIRNFKDKSLMWNLKRLPSELECWDTSLEWLRFGINGELFTRLLWFKLIDAKLCKLNMKKKMGSLLFNSVKDLLRIYFFVSFLLENSNLSKKKYLFFWRCWWEEPQESQQAFHRAFHKKWHTS